MPLHVYSTCISSQGRPNIGSSCPTGQNRKNGTKKPDLELSRTRKETKIASSRPSIASASSSRSQSVDSSQYSQASAISGHLPEEAKRSSDGTTGPQRGIVPDNRTRKPDTTLQIQPLPRSGHSLNRRRPGSEERPTSRPMPSNGPQGEVGRSKQPPRIKTYDIVEDAQSNASKRPRKPDSTKGSKAKPRPGKVGQRPSSSVGSSSGGRVSSSDRSAGSSRRHIRLGIETEFEIAHRNHNYVGHHQTLRLDEFVKVIATMYNCEVSRKHPRMHERLQICYQTDGYDRWALVEECSIAQTPSVPYGIELVSPILEAFPGSKWRDDVEAMWSFLSKDFDLRGTELCGTHIHVSLLPVFTLQDLKRIAQAAIHFEPAFEALVPIERRDNHYARSNWLDCPSLGFSYKTRLESMMALGNLPDGDGVEALTGVFDSRRYCWGFGRLNSCGTIEFRKPPYSLTADECLCWAELALSFVQTCVRCESVEQLRRVPPNVGGLRWFVSQFQEAGVNEPARMDKLWQDTHPEAMLQPVIPNYVLLQMGGQQKKRRLQKLLDDDTEANMRLASRAKEPYW